MLFDFTGDGGASCDDGASTTANVPAGSSARDADGGYRAGAAAAAGAARSAASGGSACAAAGCFRHCAGAIGVYTRS